MKFQKIKLFGCIFVILAVFISTFLWEKIKLSFSNPGISGIYSENQYHSFNDILRYVFFISLPLITWLIVYVSIFKNKFDKFIFNFNNKETSFIEKNNFTKFIFLLIFFLLILEFLSLNFPLQKLDLIHEGQQLSSAFRNYLDGSLWSKSYVTVGIFYETINAKLFWNIFDKVSIGLLRYSILIYILVLKLLLLILTYKVTSLLKLDDNLKSIFLFLNSIIIINFIDYDLFTSNYISYREIPLVFGLILIADFFNKNKNSNLYLVILISLSFPTLMWSVDRGLIFNIILFSLIFYLLITKNYRQLFLSVTLLIFFWFIFFIIFREEFNYFILNTLSIFTEMNYIHGIIHPTPFSDDQNSTRATKTLLAILICLIISFTLFFNSNKKFSNQLKFILLYISILSFLSYIYALGRSDGPHIKESSAYPLLFLTYYSLILIFNYIQTKLKYFKSQKLMISILVVIICFFNFDINFNNIKDYNKRFDQYKNTSDKKFLKSKEIDLIDSLTPVIKNYECIQLFSNEVALLYLLRVKSCSKFYFIWSVGSFVNQKKLINSLKENSLIIAGGESFDWDMPLSKKLSYVNTYIDENFTEILLSHKFRVLKRIE